MNYTFDSNQENLQSQQFRFNEIWNSFPGLKKGYQSSLYTKKVDINLQKRYLTSLIKITGNISKNILKAQKKLTSLTSSPFLYPKENLHSTILDCTMFCSDIPRSRNNEICEIDSIFKSFFSLYHSFDIVGIGLNLFPSSIFAQLFTIDFEIYKMRDHLNKELEKTFNKKVGDILTPHSNLLHSNIARFSDADMLHAINTVSNLRSLPLGTLTVDTVELVITDKLFSKMNTTIIGTYYLEKQSKFLANQD